MIVGLDGRVLFASASQDQNVHIWGLSNTPDEPKVYIPYIWNTLINHPLWFSAIHNCPFVGGAPAHLQRSCQIS